MSNPQGSLLLLLERSSRLLESKKGENSNSAGDLQTVLQERLANYYAHEKIEGTTNFGSLEDAQLATAREALSFVEKVELSLLHESPSDTKHEPLLGTRDFATLRTLVSLIFKWGTGPLLSRVNQTWIVDTKGKGRRIVELDAKDERYTVVSDMATRVMSILFPSGVRGDLSPTIVATTLTNKHMVDILRCSILLGWLPPSLSTPAMPTVDHLRPFTMRLLSILSPTLLISALGSILADGPLLSPHVRKTASSFLTQQVLRPGGVLGLCEAIFGEEETSGDAVKLDKLEHISKTLLTVPAKMPPQEYFGNVVPKLISLLSDRVPASFRKAAAFTLSRMLGSGKPFQNQTVATPLIYSTLHLPFTQVLHGGNETERIPRPSTALSNLLILIANCDPSPELISNLLSPIILPLYSLAFYLGSHKTADPHVKESVQGLLVTWGRIVDATTANDILWTLVKEGRQQYWKSTLDGSVHLVPGPEETRNLDFLTPDDLKKTQGEGALDTNIFDLYPDPAHFVRFLKLLGRGDIVSDLFIQVLESYQQSKARNGDPLKSLHYLQIFMQMQLQLLGDSSSSILRKPDQLLVFIKQVLESTAPSAPGTAAQSTLNRLDVEEDSDKDSDGISAHDSDDDDPESEVVRPDDEMIETTLNLLLSVLEMHQSLSARNTPILNEIFSLLESITYSNSSSLRPLAREARLVITARLASTSTPGTGKSREVEEETAQEIYQKSLKLLQDPILPVRAHGLLLLRQLVPPRREGTAEQGARITDPALVPAILSIFLQSVQDDDSYIFLNAVQGLAAMVDRSGKEVLKGLLRDYSHGVDSMPSGSMSQQDLDVRTRIGEALGTVIQRCGTSLGKYGDILIPALISVYRASGVPVTLRTSALSLLADAINTYPLATLPYTEDLSQGMIDLLQIESRSSLNAKPGGAAANNPRNENEGENSGKSPPDDDHLTVDATHPPLRRAALHLLALLIRATARAIDDGNIILPFSAGFVRRAHITLGYMAATDDDTIVRVMAREVNEELSSFEEYLVGQDA